MADSGGLLYPVPLSKLCRDFVSTMLNPRARPTATDLMRHPWMAGLARPEHVAKAPFQPTAPLPAQVTPSPPSTAFPAPAAPTEPFRKPLLRPSLGGRTATSSAVPTLANFAPAAAPSPAMVQPSADVRIAAAAQQPGQNGAPVRPQLQPRANTSSAVPTLRSFQAGAVHFNDPNDGTIAAEAEARRRLAMGQPAQQPHGGVTFAAPPSPAPQSPALFGYERPPLQPRANSYAHHHPHMPPPLANGMQAPVKRPSGNLAMDLPAGISGIPGSPGEGATSNRMSLDYIVSSVSQPVRSPGVETHGLPQTGYFAPRPAPTSPTSAYQHHHPHFVTPQPPSPGGKMPPYLARPQLQPRSISSGAVPTLRSFLAKASAAALDADAMDTSSTTDSDSEVGGEDQNRRSNPIPTPSGGLRRSKTTHGTGTSRRREHRETEYIAATPAARNDSGYGASNGSLADEMGSDDMEL